MIWPDQTYFAKLICMGAINSSHNLDLNNRLISTKRQQQMESPTTVQQDSSDLGTEIKRGLSLNIFIIPNFHSQKARSCVAECTKAPLW